jgi:hypothetical protein
MGTERDEIDDELDALIAERKAQTAPAEMDPDAELAARLAPPPAPPKPKAPAPVAPRGTTAPPRRDGVAPNVSVVPTAPIVMPDYRSPKATPDVLGYSGPRERVTPLGQSVVGVLKQPSPMPAVSNLLVAGKQALVDRLDQGVPMPGFIDAGLEAQRQRNQAQIDAWERKTRKPLGPELPPTPPTPRTPPVASPAPARNTPPARYGEGPLDQRANQYDAFAAREAQAAAAASLEEAKRAIVEADLMDADMVDALAKAAPERIMATYEKLQSRGK